MYYYVTQVVKYSKHAMLDNGNMVPDKQFKQSGMKNRLPVPLEHVFIPELKLVQNMLCFVMVHPWNKQLLSPKSVENNECPKESWPS